MAANPRYSLPPGSLPHNGFSSNGTSALPHIDDIIAPTRRLQYDLPVRKLLELAESSLRQAEFSRDIKKLAPALQEFLKASIIVIQLIGNHRDFGFVKASKELSGRYDVLLKKIKVRQDEYARIKEQIIADNKRSGVQPENPRPSSSQGMAVDSPRSSFASDRNSAAHAPSHQRNGSVDTAASKAKPAVQPKPKSLLGNAISSGHGRSNSLTSGSGGNSMQDLAARFANLRGPQASPGQDPRIKTHQITIPPTKPSGPRQMPSPQKPKLVLDSSVPSLPKMPDAIYSPARGTGPSENGRPPTSNPRAGYGRTSSSMSAASSPSLSRQTSASDYFSSTQGLSNGSALSRTTSRESSLDLPRGDVITAENLVQVMKSRATVLLIDVRPRDEFNDGHIMHSSILCIEPTILDREDISADEIDESMVIAPGQEQSLFQKRSSYDMVIFYDERSTEVPSRASSNDGLALLSLQRALTQYNYSKELKNTPKILKGGLDAWVDMMGSGSLQSTTDPSARPRSRGRAQNITIERRRSKYVVKQLKPDDIKQWEATIQKDDRETAESPTFVRSREDFLRRFPSVSVGQESMSSPAAPPRPRYGSSHKNDLESELPSPPSRPAPALPRQSYSSLSPRPDDHEAFNGSVSIAQTIAGPVTKQPSQTPTEAPQQKFYTGLNNPHNWCYANSLLQSLLASPDFGRELADSESVGRHTVPRKADEKVDHPQLMIRIISNLFHWMSSGKFPTMKAQTLMDYVRHLCKQNNSPILFGGTNQQDAQEFMIFLLDVIHDETNIKRDVAGKECQPLDPSKTGLSVLQTAQQFWQSHLQYNESIIDRYWRLLEVTEVQCRACANRTFTFSSWFCLMLPISEATTLEAAMKKKCAPELIEDFRCDKCAKSTKSDRKEYYARLPPLVCIVLNRFGSTNRFGQTGKCTDKVTWDFNSLDLSPYFLSPKDCGPSTNGDLFPDDRAFRGPFEYECYAVLVHQGSSVNSGHYYAYVRDQSKRHQDPYAWFCCNDERVSKVRIGCGGAEDARNRVFKTGSDAVPYMAFFRRKQGR